MPRTSPVHYVNPSSISLTANANGTANDIAVYIDRNAKIKVYSPKVGLNLSSGDYQEWSLRGRNRRLANSAKKYAIYARLRHNDHEDGYLVFAAMEQYTDGPRAGQWYEKYWHVGPEGWEGGYEGEDGGAVIEPDPTYWYIKLGEVSLPENHQRTIDLDTGILGTEQFNTEWALNPDSLPLRIEFSCTISDDDAGPTPYVYWGQTLLLVAMLTEGWNGTDIERFDHWEIARDTGNAQADATWAATVNAGDFRTTGSVELQHGRGAGQGVRDDFNSAVNTTFTVNAMENTGTAESPVYAVLKSASICIMAETWEKYELSLSSAMVTYNPITQSYSPNNGVKFNIRATDQKGDTFLLTNKQVGAMGLHTQYAVIGTDSWTDITISGPDNNVAEGTVPATAFSTNKQSINVRLRNAVPKELHRTTIAFLKDGEDSKEREWIFLRSATEITFGTPAHPYPSSIAYGEVNPAGAAGHVSGDKNQDGWVPEGWWDEMQGTSDDAPYEYGAYRDFVHGDNGDSWGAFTKPKIWSHYGKDGANAAVAFCMPSVVSIPTDREGIVIADFEAEITVGIYTTHDLQLSDISIQSGGENVELGTNTVVGYDGSDLVFDGQTALFDDAVFSGETLVLGEEYSIIPSYVKVKARKGELLTEHFCEMMISGCESDGSTYTATSCLGIQRNVYAESITKRNETAYYIKNTTGVRPAEDDPNWSTTRPSLNNGEWLFTKTVIEWSDGSKTVLYTDERNPNDGLPGQNIIVDGATEMKYYVGDSNTTHPAEDSSDWKDLSQVTQTQGKWLWSKATTWYRKSGSSAGAHDAGHSVNYNVMYISKDGAAGRAIVSVTEYYKTSNKSSGETTESGWTTDVNVAMQSWGESKKYLWNYEKVEYSSGTQFEETDPQILAIWTKDGAPGKGIDSITNYYKITNSPTAPSRTDSGWDDNPVAPTADNPYLWNYEKIVWTNPTATTYTDVQLIGHFGKDGENLVRMDIDNEMDSIPCDSKANVMSKTVLTTKAKIFDGATQVTSGITVKSVESIAGVTASSSVSSGVATVSWTIAKDAVLSADKFTARITLTYKSIDYSAVFTANAVKSGAPGVSPIIYQLAPSLSQIAFKRNASGAIIDSSINLKMDIKKSEGGTTSIISIAASGLSVRYRKDGYPTSATDGTAFPASGVDVLPTDSNIFVAAFDGSSLTDKDTIPVVVDGAKGADSTVPGPQGDDAVNVVVSPVSMIVEQDINNKDNIAHAADNNLGQLSMQVLKGSTACNITSITAIGDHVYVSNSPSQGEYIDPDPCTWQPNSQIANMYLKGIAKDGSNNYYSTGQITLSITYADPDTNTSKTINSIIAKVYVNLIGTWKETIEGDTKQAIAESTWFDIDANGNIVESDRLGTFEQSSKKALSRLDEQTYVTVKSDPYASFEIETAGRYRVVLDMNSKSGESYTDDETTITLKRGSTTVKTYSNQKYYDRLEDTLTLTAGTYTITASPQVTIVNLAVYFATKTKYSEINQTVDSITSTVNASTGNKNLFSFTACQFRQASVDCGYPAVQSYGLFLKFAGTTWDTGRMTRIAIPSLEQGNYYTFSCQAKMTSSNATIDIDLGDSTGKTVSLTNAWSEISVTLQLTNANKWIDIGINSGYTSGNYALLRHIKIEKGKMATAFCVAQEDVNNVTNVRPVDEWTMQSLAEDTTVTCPSGKKVYRTTALPAAPTSQEGQTSKYIDYISKDGLTTIEIGKVYTISFWAKSSANNTHLMYLYLWPEISAGQSQDFIEVDGQSEAIKTDGQTYIKLTTEWKKRYVHFYVLSKKKNEQNPSVYDPVNCIPFRLIRNYNQDWNNSGTVYISDVQFCEGYVSDDNISVNEAYSEIKQTADQILLNVKNGLSDVGISILGNEDKIVAKAGTFEVHNSNDVKTFEIDNDGNLQSSGNAAFSGTVYANSGYFNGSLRTTFHNIANEPGWFQCSSDDPWVQQGYGVGWNYLVGDYDNMCMVARKETSNNLHIRLPNTPSMIGRRIIFYEMNQPPYSNNGISQFEIRQLNHAAFVGVSADGHALIDFRAVYGVEICGGVVEFLAVPHPTDATICTWAIVNIDGCIWSYTTTQ